MAIWRLLAKRFSSSFDRGTTLHLEMHSLEDLLVPFRPIRACTDDLVVANPFVHDGPLRAAHRIQIVI